MTAPVVTIDGPSGAGKGTLARLLAQELSFHLLDSGAIYRILGLSALHQGVSLSEPQGLARLADGLAVEFRAESDRTLVFIDQREVSDSLRNQQVAEAASQIAVYPEVRAALLALQRRMAVPPGLVGDGRDLGTVVFPTAVLKIFLEATVEIRANRRYHELIESGQTVERSAILRDLEIRDIRDRTRAVAPLVAAEDAFVIDSSEQTPVELLARVRALCIDRGLIKHSQ